MTIWIPGKFPNFNDYIAAERRHRMIAATMKKKWTGIVQGAVEEHLLNDLKVAGVKPPITDYSFIQEYPITVHFVVHEENKRRDVDNITATVSKFCLDGMVQAGLIPDDSQKYINKIECDLVIDGKVGVEIIIHD